METVLLAAALVFDPYVLAVMLAAALFGLFVGSIPGLTATMASAALPPARSVIHASAVPDCSILAPSYVPLRTMIVSPGATLLTAC